MVDGWFCLQTTKLSRVLRLTHTEDVILSYGVIQKSVCSKSKLLKRTNWKLSFTNEHTRPRALRELY